MKTTVSFAVLLFAISAFFSNCNGQTLKQPDIEYLTTHNIELIDSTKLYRDVLKDNGKTKMVVIFTNYCVGTEFIFRDIKSYKKMYGDKLEYILCSSAPKNEMDDLVKILKSHNYEDKVYFINPEVYKEFRSDDRKKGFNFRNTICIPCRKDEIGTPYRIFFSPLKEVLFYGYASRNNFEAMLSNHFQNADSVKNQ